MTLKESDGIDLYEISPHSSDNSHTELYETMFSEYALGTARFAASKNNGGVSAYRQFEEMQKNIIRPNLRCNGTKEKETTCWYQAVSNLKEIINGILNTLKLFLSMFWFFKEFSNKVQFSCEQVNIKSKRLYTGRENSMDYIEAK